MFPISYETFFGREFPLRKLDFIEAPQLKNECIPSAGAVMIHNSVFPVNFNDPLSVINTGTLFYNAVCSMWIGHELYFNWWDAYWM